MHSIIIQHQEDHPHNPGWWRFGRPVHRIVSELPEISNDVRWTYGSAEQAADEQARWDAANPNG